jgi:hypothetical protein
MHDVLGRPLCEKSMEGGSFICASKIDNSQALTRRHVASSSQGCHPFKLGNV